MASVIEQVPFARYTGNGLATVYAYKFELLQAADMVVSIDGVEQPDSLYTLAGVGVQAGGTVTFLAPPANGADVLLQRLIKLERLIDYQNNGDLQSPVLNLDFKRLWQAAQQLSAAGIGGLRAPFPEILDELPPADKRRGLQLLFHPTTGQPYLAAPVTGTAADVLVQLADTASGKGAALVGFDRTLNYAANTIGWAEASSSGGCSVLRYIPVEEWAAILAGTSTYDATAAINSAISAEKHVFLPRGVFNVNPDVGIQVVTGCTIDGAGKNKTTIVALPNGGTLAELAAHTKGSIIKRAFSPGVANARLNEVTLRDFAVVMNHPTATVTTTEIQIGIDMRHVSRFQIERVHVGNIAPLSGTYTKADPGSYAVQGYGIVVGNINTGNVAYCGGEVGQIRDCSVWGAYKTIVQDDETLSPLSGAHAISVTGCDIQAAHHLLVQEQQYTTGCIWQGNTLQDCKKQPGGASSSYVMRIAGFANRSIGGYIEAGAGADFILRFDSASATNHVELDHATATNAAEICSDTGVLNYARIRANTGTISGGYDSKGRHVELYDRSYLSPWVKFHWSGSAIVLDAGIGCTVVRNGTGDYSITFTKPFRLNEYSMELAADSDVSGNGVMVDVASHGTTTLRIQCWKTTVTPTVATVDPRFVWARFTQ